MTLKEAKKILKKEGFILSLASKVINQTGAIRGFEKPEVCEAIKVANANRWTVGLSTIEWDEREKRLKKEYGKNHVKGGDPIPGSPALKEAASQFNDALLDEQAKKIARLKKIIRKKNMKIEELRKESSEHLRGKVKMFGETVDLSQELCDKNEDIRLSKIREKNLTEVCQKYMKENEELRKELANKVVDKIDAQALKSAESALAEKDEVIADLGNELAATKEELEAFKESYKRRLKDDSEHFEHIQKICNAGLQKWLIESEYLEKDKPFCFPQLPELSEEEEKKLNAAKLSNITAKCMKAARESINDVFESYAAKYAKSTLDELKDKAYESFNAKAHKLGLVGSKDGKGVPDQMEEEKKLSLFRDDSVGAATNQKDISPSLKVTVRLFGDDVRDLFKNMQHLW